MMKFTDLHLNDKLLKGIEEAGFISLMPVQEETLVHTLKGRDAYVQSQTGTGKTAAFLITIFQLSLDKEGTAETAKRRKALIVAPTRELAIQIEKEAKVLGRYLDFKIGCFYGGVGYNIQERLLEQGVDIIVGTPGRLLDFLHKRKLDFRDIGFVVIDEADRLFDMGFLPDLRRIMDSMARRLARQVMLFSATLDATTRAIAREYMKNPARVEIAPEQVTVDKVTQLLYHVGEREKMNLMLGILKKELPRNALIFTNMKHEADRVARHLEYNGYKCQHISGDLPQSKRLQIIDHFKSGKLPFLVATDVAARGLHVDDLELIINYDLPGDCENYVHRIGRTARAGKSGKAIALACEKYIYNLEAIEAYIGMKIPVGHPEEDLFLEDKARDMGFGKAPRRPRGGPVKSKARSRKAPGASRPKPTPTHEDKRASGKKPTETKAAKKLHKEPPGRRHPGKKKSKGNQKISSLEERLAYYQKKYGDNFDVQNMQKPAETPAKKRSFLNKIAVFFKRKK
jgi:ATP-dependent RNA helicase RhlB